MKAVILAAGESSRFQPVSDRRHKALTEVLGRTVIEHTIDELREAGVEEVVVVQGSSRDIQQRIGDAADHYVEQEEPRGMGDALEQARHLLDDRFLVLTPYRANASQFFEPLIEKAEAEDADTVLVSTGTEEPGKYGMLELDSDGKAVDIVEKPEPSETPSDQRVVGMYLLHQGFFEYLDQADKGEYQYEDALAKQMEDGPAAVLQIEEQVNSLKYPWDLFPVVEELLEKADEKVSDKADIADSAEIKDKVIVEPEATVYENAVIKGPAYIGKGATVGNNALIRDGTILEEDATAGANAEVKNSVLQPGSSTHSGFIGDSVIGRNTSIGAETVLANRGFRRNSERPEISSMLLGKEEERNTGWQSLGAFIGEEVDIGVNVSLMPGVQIGSGATIGPGTVVHENVEQDTTVYVKQEKVYKD